MTRKCPQCNLIYTDVEIIFCEQDGTALLNVNEAAQNTVASNPSNLAPTIQMPAVPQAESRTGGFNYTYPVILILAILLTGSVVALIYEKGKDTPVPNSIQTEASTTTAQNNQPPVALTPASQPAQTSSEQPRFFVTDCQSVKDSRTNLEWFVGPNQNMTWYEAEQWTTNLRACGGGWRMPSIQEIGTLYNPNWSAGRGYFTNGKYFPAHIHPTFSAIGDGSWVWSNQQNGSNARSFNLNQGKAVEFSATNTTFSTRAFAVKNR